MDLSKTLKWRDGNDNTNGNANANVNADAKVSTIALPVLCTGELMMYLIHILITTCQKSFRLGP